MYCQVPWFSPEHGFLKYFYSVHLGNLHIQQNHVAIIVTPMILCFPAVIDAGELAFSVPESSKSSLPGGSREGVWSGWSEPVSVHHGLHYRSQALSWKFKGKGQVYLLSDNLHKIMSILEQ